VLWKTFGPKQKELTGNCKNMHDEELHNLRQTGHDRHENANKVSVGKPKQNKSPGTPRL
jgi:hypothetical protein